MGCTSGYFKNGAVESRMGMFILTHVVRDPISIKVLTPSLIKHGSHIDQNSDPGFDPKRDLNLIKILTPSLIQNEISC